MQEAFDDLHRSFAELKAAVWAERWSLARTVIVVELILAAGWLVSRV